MGKTLRVPNDPGIKSPIDLETASPINPINPARNLVCPFIDRITLVVHAIFCTAGFANCGCIIFNIIAQAFSKWAIGVLILNALISSYYAFRLIRHESPFNINRYKMPIMTIPMILYIIVIIILHNTHILAGTYTEFLYDLAVGCIYVCVFVLDYMLYQLLICRGIH